MLFWAVYFSVSFSLIVVTIGGWMCESSVGWHGGCASRMEWCQVVWSHGWTHCQVHCDMPGQQIP